MDETLRSIISQMDGWAHAEPDEIEHIPGKTNQNYKIRMGDQRYVVRVSGPNTVLLGIDRKVEYAVLKEVASIGVGPEPILFVEPEGHMISRFIDGRQWEPEELKTDTNLRRLAQTMKRCHQLPGIDAVHNPFRTVEEFIKVIRSFDEALPDDIDDFLAKMYEYENALSDPPSPVGLCHNDIWVGNLLDDGNVRILDWEFAGMGDVYFDLAAPAIFQNMTDDNERVFLDAYFGKCTEDHIRRLKMMEFMVHFRDATWSLVQMGRFGDDDEHYQKYADDSFKGMRGTY